MKTITFDEWILWICSRNKICFNFHFIFALCSRNEWPNFFFLLNYIHQKVWTKKQKFSCISIVSKLHSSFIFLVLLKFWCMVLSIALYKIVQCHMQTNTKKRWKKKANMSPRRKEKTQSRCYTRCSVLHECIRSLQTILLQSVCWIGKIEMNDGAFGLKKKWATMEARRGKEEKAAKILSNAIVFTTRRLVEVCVQLKKITSTLREMRPSMVFVCVWCTNEPKFSFEFIWHHL